MKTWSKFFCIIVSIVGFASFAQATMIYQVGLMDDFSGGPDISSPSAQFMASVAANQDHSQSTVIQSFQDFDLVAGVNGLNNNGVAHTFTSLPSQIESATFDIRIRAGNDPYTNSDQLIFSFVEYATDNWVDKIAWDRSFGACTSGVGTYDPGLFGSWTYGDDITLSLDLAALPLIGGGTFNLIPLIAYYGFFDVMVEDETGVDYMTLSITPIPEPATIILLGIGFVGGIVRHRRKHKNDKLAY